MARPGSLTDDQVREIRQHWAEEMARHGSRTLTIEALRERYGSVITREKVLHLIYFKTYQRVA